jgi:hypothetical protein
MMFFLLPLIFTVPGMTVVFFLAAFYFKDKSHRLPYVFLRKISALLSAFCGAITFVLGLSTEGLFGLFAFLVLCPLGARCVLDVLGSHKLCREAKLKYMRQHAERAGLTEQEREDIVNRNFLFKHRWGVQAEAKAVSHLRDANRLGLAGLSTPDAYALAATSEASVQDMQDWLSMYFLWDGYSHKQIGQKLGCADVRGLIPSAKKPVPKLPESVVIWTNMLISVSVLALALALAYLLQSATQSP